MLNLLLNNAATNNIDKDTFINLFPYSIRHCWQFRGRKRYDKFPFNK